MSAAMQAEVGGERIPVALLVALLNNTNPRIYRGHLYGGAAPQNAA
jgi:hypothetical protein